MPVAALPGHISPGPAAQRLSERHGKLRPASAIQAGAHEAAVQHLFAAGQSEYILLEDDPQPALLPGVQPHADNPLLSRFAVGLGGLGRRFPGIVITGFVAVAALSVAGMLRLQTDTFSIGYLPICEKRSFPLSGRKKIDSMNDDHLASAENCPIRSLLVLWQSQ